MLPKIFVEIKVDPDKKSRQKNLIFPTDNNNPKQIPHISHSFSQQPHRDWKILAQNSSNNRKTFLKKDELEFLRQYNSKSKEKSNIGENLVQNKGKVTVVT